MIDRGTGAVTLRYVGAFCLALVLGLFASFLYEQSAGEGLVIRGVYIDQVPLAGLDPAGVEAALAPRRTALEEQRFELTLGEEALTADAGQLGLSFDVQQVTQRALRAGRDGALPVRFGFWLSRLFGRWQVEPKVSLDDDQLRELLEPWLEKRLSKPRVPSLKRGSKPELDPGQSGVVVEWDALKEALSRSAHKGDIAAFGATPSDADEAPSDAAAQAPSDAAAEAPSDAAAKAPSGTAVDAPSDAAAEAPSETADEALSETAIDAPSETAVDAPSATAEAPAAVSRISIPTTSLPPPIPVAAVEREQARLKALLSRPVVVKHAETGAERWLSTKLLGRAVQLPSLTTVEDSAEKGSAEKDVAKQDAKNAKKGAAGTESSANTSVAPEAAFGLRLSEETIRRALAPLLLEVEQRPREAEFDFSRSGPPKIGESAQGVHLDWPKLEAALWKEAGDTKTKGRHLQLPLLVTEPRLSREKAETLGVKGLISAFSTQHPCCQVRVKNIHRAASILNGVVLLPGETFSLNELLGQRTAASGYFEAPTIVHGEMKKVYGGGISQLATTLFNAVLRGGYEIVQRQPHSIYFPRYPEGHEATVSFPEPDLIFRNDTDAAMVIQTQYASTFIRIAIYGDVAGRTTKISKSRRYATVDPPIEYEADDEMDPAHSKRLRAGQLGWTLLVSRVVTFADGTKKEEKREVVYNPRAELVRVHSCMIPEGEEGHTGEDCPMPEDECNGPECERECEDGVEDCEFGADDEGEFDPESEAAPEDY